MNNTNASFLHVFSQNEKWFCKLAKNSADEFSYSITNQYLRRFLALRDRKITMTIVILPFVISKEFWNCNFLECQSVSSQVFSILMDNLRWSKWEIAQNKLHFG